MITYDSNNNIVSENDSIIGTGSIVETNNREYSIIIVGDSSGDGRINSADLLKVIKHLKTTAPLGEKQQLAADCTYDGNINSADLLKIIKFLKGNTTINIKE